MVTSNYALNGFGVSGTAGEVNGCNVRDNYYLNTSTVSVGDMLMDDGTIYTPSYNSSGALVFPTGYTSSNVVGVCFWSNANNDYKLGRCWIVSLVETSMSWAPTAPYNPIDVSGVYNYTDPSIVILDFNGATDTNYITTDAGHTAYITTSNCAAKYSVSYTAGSGLVSWFLPSMGQLREMEKQMTTLNTLLTKLGKTNLTGTYWSSNESSQQQSWTYPFPLSGTPAFNNKTASYKVRPIAVVYKTN